MRRFRRGKVVRTQLQRKVVLPWMLSEDSGELAKAKQENK